MSEPHVLTLHGVPFSIGRAAYWDEQPSTSANLHVGPRVWVEVQPRPVGVSFFAALDTGSGFCIIDDSRASGLAFEPMGARIKLLTAYGRMECELVRLGLTVIAVEGASVDVETTFAIASRADGWPSGLVILGYQGMLERMRLALDPSRSHFYFGPLP